MAKKTTGKKKTMTPAEILRAFRNVEDGFKPQIKALRAAVRQRKAITPKLIAALKDVVDRPGYYRRQEDNWMPVFAIYLLAQFRETRALEPLMRFFSLDDTTLRFLAGDIIPEHGSSILASICAGNSAPLLRLALNENNAYIVRDVAMEALVVQYLWGERSRKAVTADLRTLHDSLARPGDKAVWAAWVNLVIDFNAFELLAEARQVYADGLTFPGFVDPDDLDPKPSQGKGSKTFDQQYQELLDRCVAVDAVENFIHCFARKRKWMELEDEESEAEEENEIGEEKDEKDNPFPDFRRNRLGDDFGQN